MRIGISKKKRRVLVFVLLMFCFWWFLQSWIAYRNVSPSVELTRAHVVSAVWTQKPADDMTENEVSPVAWLKGALDMNVFLVGHYWVIMWCLIALALLAVIPEASDKTKE